MENEGTIVRTEQDIKSKGMEHESPTDQQTDCSLVNPSPKDNCETDVERAVQQCVDHIIDLEQNSLIVPETVIDNQVPELNNIENCDLKSSPDKFPEVPDNVDSVQKKSPHKLPGDNVAGRGQMKSLHNKTKQPAFSLVPYRIGDSSSESNSSEDSESSSESDTSEDSESSSSSDSESSTDKSHADIFLTKRTNTKPTPKSVKTVGELGIEDLPPIDSLHITLPETERLKVGKIFKFVDTLVTIETMDSVLKHTLDVDSFLFLDDGTCLGQVFDVFGQTLHPFYAVRFNSQSDIVTRGIAIGDPVYYAPGRQDLTLYVNLGQLQRQRGSDASWKNNNEPPAECLDYSDDEQEKAARASLRARRKGREENPANPSKPEDSNNSTKRKRPARVCRSQSLNRCPSQGPIVSPATFYPPVPSQANFAPPRFAPSFQGAPSWPPRGPWQAYERNAPPPPPFSYSPVQNPEVPFQWTPPIGPPHMQFPPPPPQQMGPTPFQMPPPPPPLPPYSMPHYNFRR